MFVFLFLIFFVLSFRHENTFRCTMGSFEVTLDFTKGYEKTPKW